MVTGELGGAGDRVGTGERPVQQGPGGQSEAEPGEDEQRERAEPGAGRAATGTATALRGGRPGSRGGGRVGDGHQETALSQFSASVALALSSSSELGKAGVPATSGSLATKVLSAVPSSVMAGSSTGRA